MAFENSQTFAFESKKKVDTYQFASTCRVEVQEGKQIKKVVCTKAMPKMMYSEKSEGAISFSGKTAYQVMYQTEEGELASVFSEIEWQDKIDYLGNDTYFLCPRIVENTITGFSSSEVQISSLIEVNIYAIDSNKVASVVNLTPDYVTKQRNVEYQKLVNSINQTFTEVHEEDINQKVDQVLLYDAEVVLKNATAGIDSITLEGQIYISTYILNEGIVQLLNKTIDFKQEMAMLSVVPNNILETEIALNMLKVTANVNQTDKQTNLVYSMELAVNVVAFSKDYADIIEDAFSTQKEIAISSQCVENSVLQEQNSYSVNVNGSVDLNREDIDMLCIVNSVQASVTENAPTLIKGVVELNAVALTENNEYVKIEGIIPFSVEKTDSYEELNVSARVVSYKLRGKEIEVTLELNIKYKKQTIEYIPYLSSIEEKEQKQQNQSAIRVYITSDSEDLYKVAKAMNVRPETIASQNNIEGEHISQNSRLVVYSPLDIEF